MSGPKKMRPGKRIPIVFSHDVMRSRHSYSVLCAELAAHGYVVFALDHHDGSCTHTVKSTVDENA